MTTQLTSDSYISMSPYQIELVVDGEITRFMDLREFNNQTAMVPISNHENPGCVRFVDPIPGLIVVETPPTICTTANHAIMLPWVAWFIVPDMTLSSFSIYPYAMPHQLQKTRNQLYYLPFTAADEPLVQMSLNRLRQRKNLIGHARNAAIRQLGNMNALNPETIPSSWPEEGFDALAHWHSLDLEEVLSSPFQGAKTFSETLEMLKTAHGHNKNLYERTKVILEKYGSLPQV